MNKKEIISLILIFLMAFSISFYTISKIPVGGDDSSLMHHIFLLTDGHIRDWGIYKFGIPYFYLPSFILLGFNRIALRFSQSLFLALTVVTSYFFIKNFYEKKIAIISSFMLSLFPFFILGNRAEFPIMSLIFMISLYLIAKFDQSERKIYLFAVFFVLGQGITIDLSFIYVLVSLVVSLSIFQIADFREIIFSTKYPPLLILSTLLGASPIIIANFLQDFPTLSFVLKNSINTGLKYNNLNFLGNLGMRLNNLSYILTSSARGFSFIPVNIFFFGLAVPVLIFSRNRKDFFLLSILSFFIVLMTFVPNFPHPLQLFVITPLLPIIMSRGIYLLNNLLPRITKERILLVLVVIFAIFQIKFIHATNLKLNDDNSLIYTGEFLAEHEKCFGNFSTILVPFHQQNHYLSVLYPKKNITAIPSGMKRVQSSGGYKLLYYKVVNYENLLDLYNDTLDSNVAYVFFSFRQPESKVKWKRIYVCEEGMAIGKCRNPFSIFKNFAEKRNKKIKQECILETSEGKTVYKIYSLEN